MFKYVANERIGMRARELGPRPKKKLIRLAASRIWGRWRGIARYGPLPLNRSI